MNRNLIMKINLINLTILLMVLSGCIVPVRKSFIKPNVQETQKYSKVIETSSIAYHTPELKNQVDLEQKNILVSVHTYLNRTDELHIYVSVDPYEQSVKWNVDDMHIIDIESDEKVYPTKIEKWHHGSHISDNYRKEISGNIQVSQVDRPKYPQITKNRYIFHYPFKPLKHKDDRVYVLSEIVLKTPKEEIVFGPIYLKKETELFMRWIVING